MLFSGQGYSCVAKGGFQGFQNPPPHLPLGFCMGYNFKRNEILAVKENEKKINWKKHQILLLLYN